MLFVDELSLIVLFGPHQSELTTSPICAVLSVCWDARRWLVVDSLTSSTHPSFASRWWRGLSQCSAPTTATPTTVVATTIAPATQPPTTKAPSKTTPATQPPATSAPTAPPVVTSPATTQPTNSSPGDTKNCSDFSNYADAKAWFDRYFSSFGDVAGLDSDGDGIPCESLSGAPK